MHGGQKQFKVGLRSATCDLSQTGFKMCVCVYVRGGGGRERVVVVAVAVVGVYRHSCLRTHVEVR